jgi:hypothetical protein
MPAKIIAPPACWATLVTSPKIQSARAIEARKSRELARLICADLAYRDRLISITTWQKRWQNYTAIFTAKGKTKSRIYQYLWHRY